MLSNIQARDLQSVLHPYTPLHRLGEMQPLVIARAKGVMVTDTAGRDYIEGMSGLWCAGLGFGDEELIEAGVEAMRSLSYYHLFGGKGIESAIALSERLIELAPMEVGRVFFASSGSEANDTQVKLQWYLNNARGRPEKKKILSRIKSYHGVTLMAASLTGLPANHRDFDLPLDRVVHLSCPHHYRFADAGESEEDFTARLAEELRATIEREGADTIAAMIAEPVMGAGGVIIPPKGYFEAIQPILAENDIALIADEVITGFGRTGEVWGSTTVGMVPQAMSLAKQLTSAYAPLSAVLVGPEDYALLEQQSQKIGTFGHGFTYGGHPVSCAIALKTIEIYEQRGIVERVRALAPRFAGHMRRLADHPLVGEARHIGLVGGLELVASKASRKPFDPARTVGMRAALFAQDRGAIVRAIGDTLAICPPMVITEGELDELFRRIEGALDDAEAMVAKEGLREV
ncbi:MAG: aminotransferase class III-fold pyridoxal phosphate-dependent enzyme [Hyphomicrobiaceae bacterium]|nr:aminotransferase class III-fold pyridoxal phosphate-dependent enzyme [Hyphomicrobiaceae bacterium]